MSFPYEAVALRRGEHIVRLIEVAGCRGAAARAERHQQLAVRTELEHLIPSGCAWRWTGQRVGCRSLRTRGVVLTVGDPDVAIAIDEDSVREDQQSRAEALHEVS